MMPAVSEPSAFPWSRFVAPRFWGLWAALGLLRATVWLPWRLRVAVGAGAGYLGLVSLPRRRRIAAANLALCFPELGRGTRRRLLRAHFRSLGIGLVEAAACWWDSDERLRRRVTVDGLEHLERARADGVPVILLSAHFTTLEIGGRLLGLSTPFHLMYRRSGNPLLEEVIRRNRERHFERAIPRDDVKVMLRSLRDGMPVWYAPDQNYRRRNSAMVPFFGRPAATNTATSRLARIAGARVLPFFVRRLPGDSRYRLEIGPPLADFPSGDDHQDALRVNQRIESQVRESPEQYLWIHRRFKHGGPDRPDPYGRA